MCYPQPSLIQRDIVGLQNLKILTLTPGIDRPGNVNKEADTLSTIPLDINRYMLACTQETSQEVISQALSGIIAFQNRKDVWITAVSGRKKH